DARHACDSGLRSSGRHARGPRQHSYRPALRLARPADSARLKRVSVRAEYIGFGLVALFLALALLGPLIEPHDPLAQDVARRLKPPGYVDPRGGPFWLGTDGLGRDILARLIEGARVSLLIGVGGAGIAAVLGTSLGLTAGYAGRWWDALVMRVADVFQAIPFAILAI